MTTSQLIHFLFPPVSFGAALLLQDCRENESINMSNESVTGVSSDARVIRIVKILRILRIARILKLVKFVT